MANAIEILEEAGIPASNFPDEIREVLAGLSNDEAKALASIQKKVVDATPDVAGYAYFQAKSGAVGTTAGAELSAPIALRTVRPGLQVDPGKLAETDGYVVF